MTPFTLSSLASLRDLAVDTIIDVRSPAEFAEDHLPGAVSMPVLDDAQRAEVGTIYTRISRFKARRIGGALVAQNTARHLQGPLSQWEGDWQPLVYCWRGGQRSGAFATILDQVGWRVRVLEGGYRSYRRQVVATLYEQPIHHRVIVIDGGTGTAKTVLLHALAERGAQTIDLEGLAAHRGSLFGGIATPQPSQKMFDSRLAAQVISLDADRVTFVEAESAKVGERAVPPSLWKRMNAAARIRIEAPLEARSRFLARAYADLTTDVPALAALIDKLRPYHPSTTIKKWHELATEGRWVELAAALIGHHYDARYAKTAGPNGDSVQTVALADLEDDTIARAADELIARFR